MDTLLTLSNNTVKLSPMVGAIRFEGNKMVIAFLDGEELPVPLAWYPKLYYATPLQLSQWHIVGTGNIRWPELDEYISVTDLIS